MRPRRAGVFAILICIGLTSASAQPAPTLAVAGVPKPAALTVADLAAMPQETVTLNEEGESVQYAGVLLSRILARAGAPEGTAMRGRRRHFSRICRRDFHGREMSQGSTGEFHPRGSMSLVNVVYSRTFNWIGEGVTSLERQAMGPMFNDEPIELGLPKSGDTMAARLRGVDRYRGLFAQAFPGDANPITVPHVLDALALGPVFVLELLDRSRRAYRPAVFEPLAAGLRAFATRSGKSVNIPSTPSRTN